MCINLSFISVFTVTMLAIQKTEEIAVYLRELFVAELQSRSDVPLPNWSLDLLQDCQYAAKVIAKAVKNESKYSLTLTN